MDLASTILYAVGSLPFWTGQRKFQRFLRGEPGSFWKNESPLKPIYLNHHFYGALRDRPSASVSRGLEVLKRAGYVERTDLSADMPYPVLKLTGRGVLKYYNLLVLDRGVDGPLWWLHHVARLEDPPDSPLRTGGHLLLFSERRYLTQTPGHGDPQERVRDEKTVPLAEGPEGPEAGATFLLERARVRVPEGPALAVPSEGDVRRVAPDDLRRELTHFPPRTASPEEANPYVLRGRLVEDRADDDRLLRWLTLENEREDRVNVALPRERIDPDVPLETGGRYVVGPVRRFPEEDDAGSEPSLQLQPEGSLHREDRPPGR